MQLVMQTQQVEELGIPFKSMVTMNGLLLYEFNFNPNRISEKYKKKQIGLTLSKLQGLRFSPFFQIVNT